MHTSKDALYLLDLGRLIVEKALEAKKSAAESGQEFDIGRLMAYHEVVSLMQSQATAFDIGFADIGLSEIDPERDLL